MNEKGLERSKRGEGSQGKTAREPKPTGRSKLFEQKFRIEVLGEEVLQKDLGGRVGREVTPEGTERQRDQVQTWTSRFTGQSETEGLSVFPLGASNESPIGSCRDFEPYFATTTLRSVTDPPQRPSRKRTA